MNLYGTLDTNHLMIPGITALAYLLQHIALKLNHLIYVHESGWNA